MISIQLCFDGIAYWSSFSKVTRIFQGIHSIFDYKLMVYNWSKCCGNVFAQLYELFNNSRCSYCLEKYFQVCANFLIFEQANLSIRAHLEVVTT